MLVRTKSGTGGCEGVEDASLSIRLNRWILKPIGAWPAPSVVPWRDKCLSHLLKAVCFGLIVMLLVPSGLYVILEDKDTYHRIKLSGPLSFCLMALVKYSSLILRQGDIRRCVEFIEADWRDVKHLEDRRIMADNANFGRRLVVIYASFMYGSAVFYYLALPISAGKVVEDDGNLTYRPLVCPVARFIVDTRASPVNEIFFCIQCMCGILNHAITVGACSLAAVFAMHACGQLQVLMTWLEHLVDGREDLDENSSGRLADIVEQHIRIISFLSLTEKILQQISLVEVVGCTMHMCLIGYHILMEWEYSEQASSVMYFTLFVSITFNVFIFCYIGELVAEQCKKVGERTYLIDWYRLPGKDGLGLTLIMAMSNSTIKLTAGNIIDLSLSSFGDVVKTALGYLNMLRTLTVGSV